MTEEIDKFLEENELFIDFINSVINDSGEKLSCTEKEAGDLLNFLVDFICDVRVRYIKDNKNKRMLMCNAC